ncbi:MAG: hypothetical protein ACUVT1_07235 [Anaerolineae bacterium]
MVFASLLGVLSVVMWVSVIGNETLQQNRDLLLYRYIEKITPNIQVLMLPSSSPFILDPGTLLGSTAPLSATATVTP